jgi:hypothetical protein
MMNPTGRITVLSVLGRHALESIAGPFCPSGVSFLY